MPRRRPASDIDSQLLAIAQRMTAEIADLIRRHISDVIRRAIDAPAVLSTIRPRHPRKQRGDGAALQARLLAAMGASKKGASLADVIKRTGADRGAVKYHLRALRAQKKAKVVGTRRTARWLAV